MFKKIYLCLFLLPITAYSKNCEQYVNIYTNYQILPLVYDYSKSVKELVYKEDSYPIGLFQSNISVSLKAVNKKSKECLVVDSIDIVISGFPKIFVSKEAQIFPCIYKMTHTHEMKHYNYFMKTISNLRFNLRTYVNDIYSNTYYHEGVEKEKMNELNQKIDNFLEQEKIKERNFLDSEESYRREYLACPIEEVELKKIIRKNV